MRVSSSLRGLKKDIRADSGKIEAEGRLRRRRHYERKQPRSAERGCRVSSSRLTTEPLQEFHCNGIPAQCQHEQQHYNECNVDRVTQMFHSLIPPRTS